MVVHLNLTEMLTSNLQDMAVRSDVQQAGVLVLRESERQRHSDINIHLHWCLSCFSDLCDSIYGPWRQYVISQRPTVTRRQTKEETVVVTLQKRQDSASGTGDALRGVKHHPHHLVTPHASSPRQSLDLLVANLTLAGAAVGSDPVMSRYLRKSGTFLVLFFAPLVSMSVTYPASG